MHLVFSASEEFDKNMLEIFKINVIFSRIIMLGSDGFR